MPHLYISILKKSALLLLIFSLFWGCFLFPEEKEDPTVSTPVISPSSDLIASSEYVSISTSTEKAAVYYTLDGSDPDQNDTRYTGGFFLSESSSTTVRARAYRTGYKASAIATKQFEVLAGKVAPVEFSPPGGYYSSDQTISLSTDTAGATIYYTLDGTEPTQGSSEYIDSIVQSGTDVTVRTRAYYPDYVPSDVTGADYYLTNISGSNLIITEVGATYYSNSPHWVEIYNPTGSTLDLSNYKLRAQSIEIYPTSSTSTSGIRLFDGMVGTIDPGEYKILRVAAKGRDSNGVYISYVTTAVNPQEIRIPYKVESSIEYSPIWNGSGFVELVDLTENSVDFVRWGNNSQAPATGGSFSGAGPYLENTSSSYGASIARNYNLDDTDSGNDWSATHFSTPGAVNDTIGSTDADEDGIPDSAEVPGGTYGGMPLHSWGARSGIHDIFVHIDYMDVGTSGDAATEPVEEALDKVKQAFAAEGINIHMDVGNLFVSGTDLDRYNLDDESHIVPYSQFLTLGGITASYDLYEKKAASFPLNKQWIFHYCIFGDEQDDGTSSSGLGELGAGGYAANDFIVSLGHENWAGITSKPIGLYNVQASTFMHELGHNLGLTHGGNDDTNFKPNYVSIMNYLYQIDGLPTIGDNEGDRYYFIMGYLTSGQYSTLTNDVYESSMIINYSYGNGSTLSESSIRESRGLYQPGSTSVDYDYNGETKDGYLMDVNRDGGVSSYNDYDDWANLYIPMRRDFNMALRFISEELDISFWTDRQPVAEEPPHNLMDRY